MVSSTSYRKDRTKRVYYACRKCNTLKLRKYRKTASGKLNTKKNVDNSIAKYPEKHRARTTLNYAISKGKIKKPKNCANCGKEKKLDGHHEDYSKPLIVQWLCRPCHFNKHKH